MGNHCGNLMGCNDTELQSSLDLQVRAVPMNSMRGSKIIIKSDFDSLSLHKDKDEDYSSPRNSAGERKPTLEWASDDDGELDQNP